MGPLPPRLGAGYSSGKGASFAELFVAVFDKLFVSSPTPKQHVQKAVKRSKRIGFMKFRLLLKGRQHP